MNGHELNVAEERKSETMKWKLIGLKKEMSKCQQRSLLLTFIWDTSDNIEKGKDTAN